MSKVFDFDQFWAETMPEEAERPKIVVFGETITLPAVLPARVMLRALRYQGAEDRTRLQQIEGYVNGLELFVGADTVEPWLDGGIDTTLIIQIYAHILELYTPNVAGGDVGGSGS